MTLPLKELLQQHRDLSARCEQLWHQLDLARQELKVLDTELSSRVNSLLDALGGFAGSLPSRSSEEELPVRRSGLGRSWTEMVEAAPRRRHYVVSSELKDHFAKQGGQEHEIESLSASAWRALMDRQYVTLGTRRENPLTEAIKVVLREAGKPMKVSEIHEALLVRGVDIPGKNPRNNLSAYLHNGPEFKKVEDGLWALEEREAA